MTKLKEDFEASGGVFKEWRIGDLFEQFRGKEKAPNQNLDGDCQLINETSTNNGYTRKVIPTKIFGGNAITISINYASTVFYQPKDFCASVNIAILKNNEFLNEFVGNYVVAFLKKQYAKYTYSEKISKELICGTIVSLPTFNNSLALDYMEQYISLLEEEKMLQVDKFLKDSGLNDTILTAEETAALEKFRNGEVKFEERKIGELFSCRTGDVDVQRCHLNGKGTIYINSGVTDLGIIGKTDMKARIFPANTITVDMFGNAYYRDFEYKMATHAHVFSLSHLDDKLNKENGLYISASLGYFTQLFSFNDMCNWSKMKDKKVCLPINVSNEIDYTFMQHFISALEKLVMRGVVKYKDEVLNAN